MILEGNGDGTGAESDADREEAIDDLREHLLHARVRDGGHVEGSVGDGGALLVPQHKHLVLQADEVDVLVEQLLDLLHRTDD